MGLRFRDLGLRRGRVFVLRGAGFLGYQAKLVKRFSGAIPRPQNPLVKFKEQTLKYSRVPDMI